MSPVTASAALLILASLIVGCGAPAIDVPTQTPAATGIGTAEATRAGTPGAATPYRRAPAPTATAAIARPVGGTLIWAIAEDVDTLDPHKGASALQGIVCGFLGSSLLIKDPQGEYAPYLAESWTISPDGLVWDFSLKRNVRFHNGAPLTALDYVYTIERAIDPAIWSPRVASELAPVSRAEALDDYTLRLTLKEPFFPLMEVLSEPGWLQPLSKEAIDSLGKEYARRPVGVGPFRFGEWLPGQRIVVERNPDFEWGPAFQHPGAYYIQAIEFRIIPEAEGLIAGLESGEIGWADSLSLLQAKDVPRIQATDSYDILEGLQQGLWPYLLFNVDRWPFDDVRVRQALNYALDREALMKTIALGQAIEQKSPLSPSQYGYSARVEGLGYSYDPERAKALLEEAGFFAGEDGILVQDGEPFEITIDCLSSEFWVNVATITQQQFEAHGIRAQIRESDASLALSVLREGDYDIGVMGLTAPEADILYQMFHSSQIPGRNMSQVRDAELDDTLEATRSTTDAIERQRLVDRAQEYVIENAYIGFMFVPKTFGALTNKVKGAIFSSRTNMIYLGDAYFETE